MEIPTLLAALVLTPFFYESFTIESGSMMPTLMPGDTFVVSRTVYAMGEPERGDVVVFRRPDDPSVSFAKRLIGLPGDEIQMIDGVLNLNGQPVPRRQVEDFIGSDRWGNAVQIARYVETLPGGREYEILEETDTGYLDNTPPFLVPDGHVFVLGDHRDNSLDSRVMQQLGYIPEANLLGRAEYRWPDLAIGAPFAVEAID